MNKIEEDETKIEAKSLNALLESNNSLECYEMNESISESVPPKGHNNEEKSTTINSATSMLGIKTTDSIAEQIDLLKEYPLKLSESEDSRISCIEAWDLNLYIGTDQGEIIHMYKLDDESGFIKISKQKLSAAAKPIRKILILSEISIVLIHYGSTVTGFHLPELSPANIGKAKNVSDITLDYKDLSISQKTKSTKVAAHFYHDQIYSKAILFTNKAIKFLKVFKDSMKLYREIHVSDLRNGLCLGDRIIYSTEKEYYLYDTSAEQILCTFPMSNDTAQGMPPIIKAAGLDEVFIVGCGGDKTSPAVGMFINTQGDVTRGTITFEQYPQYVCIEHPFLLSSVENRISVFLIESQKKVQETKVEEVNYLQLFKCSRTFEIKNSDLMKKITLVPLVSIMDNNEIQRIAAEADIAIKKAVYFSRIISADGRGNYLKLLKLQSRYDRLITCFFSADLDNCNLILDKLHLELEETPDDSFIVTLIGIFLLRWERVDQILEYWTKYLTLLDPRLMIYAFQSDQKAFPIYGSVWIYQVFVEYFENLQHKEKSIDMMKTFYKYLLNCCSHEYEQDHINKMKSVELTILQVASILKEDLSVIVNMIKYAKDEVVEKLLQNKKYFILSLFYSKMDEPREFLFYWKGLVEGKFSDKDFNSNYEKSDAIKFSSEYILSNHVDDESIIGPYSEWLFTQDPLYAIQFINDTRISYLTLNDLKILNILREKQSSVLIDYLEYILEVKNEKQFIGDLIISYFESLMEFLESHSDVSKELEDGLSNYIKMKKPKMSLFNYWQFIDSSILKNRKISLIHRKLYGLLSVVPSGVESVFGHQPVLDWCNSKMSTTNLKQKFPLICLIILERTNSPVEVLNLFIDFEDFKSAEIYAMNTNLYKIDSDFFPKHETKTLDTKSMDGAVATPQKHLLEKIFDVYLKKNENELIDDFLFKYDLLNSNIEDEVSIAGRADQFVDVINKVPDNFPVLRLKRFLTNHLVEMKSYEEELTVKKTILRLETNRVIKLRDLQSDEG